VTADPAAAEQFYEPLFGWDVEEVEGAGGYRIIKNASRSNGGVMPAALVGSGPEPYWIPYFNGGDLETAPAWIDNGGGRMIVGPLQVPAGRIAVAQDPQGAVFALFEGEVDE
jgi:predicted enzyme related to lactoylglutathione lyase